MNPRKSGSTLFNRKIFRYRRRLSEGEVCDDRLIVADHDLTARNSRLTPDVSQRYRPANPAEGQGSGACNFADIFSPAENSGSRGDLLHALYYKPRELPVNRSA